MNSCYSMEQVKTIQGMHISTQFKYVIHIDICLAELDSFMPEDMICWTLSAGALPIHVLCTVY